MEEWPGDVLARFDGSQDECMSEIYRDVGVVLRTYKLREADRIIVIHTRDNGKVRAVAKGVRKTKSKFGARLEPMSHVSLQLYRGRELDIVTQAESVEPLAPMLSSLDRASQGLAVLEAADQLSLEREPNPRLYQMIVGVLRTIAQKPSPLNVPAFYWKLLAYEGVRPQLDACVRCGESGPETQLVAFDLNEGGVLCRSCRSGQSISPGALDLLRNILGGRLAYALAQEESPITHEVSGLATRALEFHIERRLKAIAMFEAH
jgi:DNA repair protein RecO (recombination protein O)